MPKQILEMTEHVNLKKVDLKDICRTCLGQGELQPLFRICTCLDEEECVAEKLMTCTLIQVKF